MPIAPAYEPLTERIGILFSLVKMMYCSRKLHIPAAPIFKPEFADDNSEAAQIILDALGFDPCNLDDLAARTELSIADLSSELMLLELAGQVEKRAGNVYSRCV
jgi:predicted Rossmann fold nucleotide-binding protein DprA/Smf involved in DNA uptake